MDNILKFLTVLGVDNATIDTLKADALPEGFSIEETAKQHQEKRRELILNNEDLQKEMKRKYSKELYPAISKPILGLLKDKVGLTDEDIKGAVKDGEEFPNLKSVVEFAIDRSKNGGNEQVDEVKKELFATRSMLEAEKERFQSEVEAIKGQYETERRMERVKREFETVVSGLDVIIDKGAATNLLFTDLTNEYSFDLGDKGLDVKTKGGNKVDNGKDFLTAADVIRDRAERMAIIKKSNGGTHEPPTTGSKTKPAGELSERARRLQEVAERQNKR